MHYLFQRIVPNENEWQKPSPGRLVQSGHDKNYLKQTGFGHEDWNFNKKLLIGGYVYGYLYYTPVDHREPFSVAFAVYEPGDGWHLVGLYRNADYVPEGAPASAKVTSIKTRHLAELLDADSLGGEYDFTTVDQIRRKIAHDARYCRWKVHPRDIMALSAPVKIPQKLFDTGGKHYRTPTFMTEQQFNLLRSLAVRFAAREGNRDAEDSDASNEEFPEGKKFRNLHTKRERSVKLIAKAKAAFKQKHGRLFCQVCRFDFERKYGRLGKDFIEAHHTIPLSELSRKLTSKIDDLAMVCSNCHKMLHRKRPWLPMDHLRRLLS